MLQSRVDGLVQELSSSRADGLALRTKIEILQADLVNSRAALAEVKVRRHLVVIKYLRWRRMSSYK